MDVHKPKPVRSWRELLTEIGVIAQFARTAQLDLTFGEKAERASASHV